MSKSFIRTSDEDTANKLRKAGFIEVGKQGNCYCFINNEKIKLTFDTKNIHYTSALALTSQ